MSRNPRCGHTAVREPDPSHATGQSLLVANKAAFKMCINAYSPRISSFNRLALRISVIIGLGLITACCDGGLIEVESNIGSTEIDKILRQQGHNANSFFPTELSPLSIALKAFLVERAREGGAKEIERTLSEAGASCVLSAGSTFRCEMSREQVMRSADFFNAHYARTDWIVSISYDRQGNTIGNIHVTYKEKYELMK